MFVKGQVGGNYSAYCFSHSYSKDRMLATKNLKRCNAVLHRSYAVLTTRSVTASPPPARL